MTFQPDRRQTPREPDRIPWVPPMDWEVKSVWYWIKKRIRQKG